MLGMKKIVHQPRLNQNAFWEKRQRMRITATFTPTVCSTQAKSTQPPTSQYRFTTRFYSNEMIKCHPLYDQCGLTVGTLHDPDNDASSQFFLHSGTPAPCRTGYCSMVLFKWRRAPLCRDSMEGDAALN